jgi:N-acetylneuraminate 9-O-acetyltransferase
VRLNPSPITSTSSYSSCRTDRNDPYKCGALLNTGRWLDPVSASPIQNSFQNWQPSGCLLHEYKKRDIIPCLQERRLLLIGDSTVRQIFWAIARKIDNERAREGMITKPEDHKHENIEFVSKNLRLQFIWDPWLNSTSLLNELAQFERFSPSTVVNRGQLNSNAALVLVGVPGLWYARYGSDRYLEDFEEAISRIIRTTPSARAEARIGLADGYPRESMLLFAPIQKPIYSLLSPSRANSITPSKIDKMQETLRNISTLNRAKVLWSYSLMTSDIPELYDNTGLHVLETVADSKANILLNLYCNPGTTKGGNLHDRSCCNAYHEVDHIQRAMWFVGLLVFPVMAFYGQKSSISPIPHFRLRPGLLLAMAVFAWVVSLCYVADRTHIFEKANKQYEPRQFICACVVIGILGLATFRQNKYQGQQLKLGVHDDGFLSRDQTNEWKGWMQAIILLYHYTGGSKTLWTYETIRILVASYLFMTGYGHTQYFLRKGNFSLRRVASVLVRLNLLGCVLPFMMHTDYLFYYFTPLASFWFLVVYFTLRVKYQHNTALGFLLCKIGVSSMLTTGLIHIPGLLEFLFSGLKLVFHISWTVDEWRFRVGLDMNIVYIGMLCAIIGFHQAQDNPKIFSESGGTLFRNFHTNTSLASLILATTSAFSLTIFFVAIQSFPSKYDYNNFQPYISFIPILSYIILRNSHRQLRNRHSVVFAWLGKCSLETYILQYHIWLAGDTHGLLRTGLPWKWIDTMVLTSIFLWLSWRVKMATQTISARIVGSGNEQKLNEMHGIEPSSEQLEKSTILPPILKSKGCSSSGWREDLRLRLAIVLLCMWLLNVTYV